MLRIPPKDAFQFVCWIDGLDEIDSKVRVAVSEGTFGEGFEWEERRGLVSRRDHWRVTAYDRRGLTWTARTTDDSASLSASVKKGGPGSCNVHWRVEGPSSIVRRYAGRMDALAAFLDD